MMNPQGNRDVGNINKNQPTLSVISIPFVRIFDSSEAVDRFIENIDLELFKKSSNVKLFIVSDNQIIDRDSTKFEIRINVVMEHLNVNNWEHNQKYLNTIKPVINKACKLSHQTNLAKHNPLSSNTSTAANQKQNEDLQPHIPHHNNDSWIKKIEGSIKDPSFMTLFPFLGFFAIAAAVIATVLIGGGQPSKDPSENPPLQNSPENKDPNVSGSSPSIPPSPSPSTQNNRSRQGTR